MSAVEPGSLILVTGASGFIASHIIGELLARGFNVRGTVRTAEKGEYMKKAFVEAERFEYVIVEDLQKENGFDEAVKGVAGIMHVASPVYRTAPQGVWENIVEPAKVGTIGVLKSVVKDGGSQVRRVVITSSLAAVVDRSREAGTVFTEKDWNHQITEEALDLGAKLDPFKAYYASKVWAEQAAWKFMEENHPKFDISTIIPPLVCGPIIHPVPKTAALNTSNLHLWSYLTGSPPGDTLEMPDIPIVDVRDIAHAHIEALLRPSAGSKRVNVSNGPHDYQEFLDIVHATPELAKHFPNAHWGVPASSRTKPVKSDLDNTLSVELLGMEYRPFRETVVDAVTSLVEHAGKVGWNLTGRDGR